MDNNHHSNKDIPKIESSKEQVLVEGFNSDHKPTKPNNRLLITLIAGGVMFVALIIVFTLLLLNKPDRSQNQKAQSAECLDNPVAFSNEFTDMAKISHIAPIGAINAGSTGRSYVFIKQETDGSYPRVPIYAPVDSKITRITYARRGGPDTPGEYRLDIEAGCNIKYFFDHVDDVNDKIKDKSPKTPADNTGSGTEVSVDIKAGEFLGESDGTPMAHSWDFSVMNVSRKNTFINPSRWQSEQNLNAVCPYDMYEEKLKAKYYAALKYWNGASSDACGNPSHDVAGSLSGGWFQGDATDMQGNRILIGSFGSMTEFFIDIGNNYQDRFSIRDTATTIKPKDVKAGDSVCYSEGSKYAFFKLESDSSLKSVHGNGSCPKSLPPSGTQTWQR